jgi:glycerol transport system ATP-binding protein
MNLLPCALEDNAAVVDGARIPLADGIAARGRGRGGNLQLGIRPEFLRMASSADGGRVPVAVTGVEDLGNFKIVTVRLGGHSLKIKLPEEQVVPGDSVFLRFPPEWTKLYAGGRLVT